MTLVREVGAWDGIHLSNTRRLVLSVMPLDRRVHLLCGNLGVIEPCLDYGNPRLSAPALGIAEERVAQLVQLHSARPSRAIRYADPPSQRRA